METSIFRENDIRGLYPNELTEDTVTRIGKAFGTWHKRKGSKTLAIGGDVRLHTPEIMAWYIKAINSTGIDVIDLGIVTTPITYYSAFKLNVF